jgi:hypothetical protein
MVLHHLIHSLDRQKLRPFAGMAWLTASLAAIAFAPLGWFKTRAVTGGRLGGVAGAAADPLPQVGQLGRQGGESAAQLLDLLLLSQDERPRIGWPLQPVRVANASRRGAHLTQSLPEIQTGNRAPSRVRWVSTQPVNSNKS